MSLQMSRLSLAGVVMMLDDVELSDTLAEHVQKAARRTRQQERLPGNCVAVVVAAAAALPRHRCLALPTLLLLDGPVWSESVCSGHRSSSYSTHLNVVYYLRNPLIRPRGIHIHVQAGLEVLEHILQCCRVSCLVG